MKAHFPVAVSIALAFAMPAFAQEAAPQSPPASTGDQQPPPSDSQPATTRDQGQARARHARHRPAMQQRYSSAAMALTGDDQKTAAYQASDRQKTYPAVDHGHVPGDPPIIDHNGDQMAVANPTEATITVPPARL